MFCGEWSLVKQEFPTLTIMPLKCRCWSCDECRPDRAKRLVYEAKQGLPKVFITLTSKRRASGSPSHAARELVRAWRRIRREYVETHGKGSIPFLAVFEETKLGWPHLHIVARCSWISQKWLSKRMGALTGSPIVDVRRVDGTRKIAAYITKYIGKNPHRFAGVKRYWRSLDWLDPVPDDGPFDLVAPDGWTIVKQNWLEYAAETAAAGFEAIYERHQVHLTYRLPP